MFYFDMNQKTHTWFKTFDVSDLLQIDNGMVFGF